MAGERWIGIAEQSDYTTANTTPAQSLRYIDLDANPDQGRIIEFESARRMKEISVLGPFIGSGTINLYARPDTIGWFLKWGTGSVTSSQVDSSTVYKHDFSLGDSIKPFTTVETTGLSGVESRALEGCLVKSLTFEAPAREVCTLSVELQYAWEELISSPSMGSLSSLRPFVFHDGTIELPDGTTVASVESFSFKWSNSIPDDTHVIGSRQLQTIELEGAEVTVDMDLKFKNWNMRKLFYGSADASEPQTEEGTTSLDITLTGEETGDASYPNYTLEFSFDNVVVKESTSSRSRRDRLTERVSIEALYSANNLITLYNKTTEYPDA